MLIAVSFIFPFAMIYAAVSDLTTMTITNRVTLGLAAAFPVCAMAAGLPIESMAWHAATGFACLLLSFGFFAAGWMGGGDAKLIAVTALWFGPTALLLDYAMTCAIYGGILTLMLLQVRTMIPVCGVGFLDRLLHPETGVPYGIALGAAGLTVYSNSFWVDRAVAGLL